MNLYNKTRFRHENTSHDPHPPNILHQYPNYPHSNKLIYQALLLALIPLSNMYYLVVISLYYSTQNIANNEMSYNEPTYVYSIYFPSFWKEYLNI